MTTRHCSAECAPAAIRHDFDVSRLQGVDLSALDPVQRVLLITDGTLTGILEAVFLEPIRLVKLGQRTVAAGVPHALLEPLAGEEILERRVLLQGARTGRNYVHADSQVAIERLAPAFRRDLMESELPLGRLWIQHRLETFKELLDAGYDPEPGAAVARWFAGAAVLRRTYRVFTHHRPLIVITERFALTFGHLARETHDH
jgi:chorismate-pyruvate lyase